MKSHFLIYPVIALLFGCTSYQYFNLQSPLTEIRANQFVYDDDTLSITYSFEGHGGAINIEVFNRLDKPLIIDWKESSLILNGQSIPYWMDEALMNAEHVGYYISGRISKPTSESFIPPNSAVVTRLVQVNPRSLDFDDSRQFEKVKYGDGVAKRYQFLREDSPIDFRSYLSFKTSTESNSFFYDHTFWVSQVTQSLTPPSSDQIPDGGFYTSQSTGAGTVLGFGALMAIVWIAATSN